jgi:phosphohistidine swiveling domain-containing protein
MARLVRRVESIVPRRAREYGGKARNLARLARAGFPIPAAYAMPSTVCARVLRDALAGDEQIAALIADPSTSSERMERVAAKVRAVELPSDVRADLENAWNELVRLGARSLVVRSSSTREDQDLASAAGLHATFLNVTTLEELEERVREAWASLYSMRALDYLRSIAAVSDASMGVVIQAFVPARVSGVIFTANPLTGDPSEIVINASYGLGSAIVDGRVSPDSYRIDKASGRLRDRILGSKETRTVAHGTELADEEVPEADRHEFVLGEVLLGDLVALARRVEEQFEAPQDIEFAEVGGLVYLLQSRPITTLSRVERRDPKKREHADRSRIVWSNVNVGEALPGVATPLTWSILSGFSELGFRRAFGSLGCHVPKDAELVGNFRGRIYLNLTEFASILSQIPGLPPRTLLSLGGGGQEQLLESQYVEERGRAGFFMRLPLTVTRFLRENYRISMRVDAFEAEFAEERANLAAMDLRILSLGALVKTLRDVDKLLERSGTVMLTCYGNLLASVATLRGVLRFVARSRTDRLERELLTGLADVESAAPGLRLWHIAEMARAEPEVVALVRDTEPKDLTLRAIPEGPTRRALEKFLEVYGFRGPREAELASPRWEEEPTLLFAVLRAHVSAPDGAVRPVDAERKQRAIRERATSDMERLVPVPAHFAVRHLLRLVQRFTRLRERLRSYVTEVLGMYRKIALDVSRRLYTRDPAYGPDAAFFLTHDEICAIGAGDGRSFVSLVRRRRRQYERDLALPDPPDTFVGYPPDVQLVLERPNTLVGLAAASGSVEGIARVLRTPGDAAEFRAGEVLVAPYADVGWSPLFTCATAVVTDLGGPLSHASVVAREYGVPAVVNVKVGTRVIKTGDRIRVDGDAGVVELLDAPKPT